MLDTLTLSPSLSSSLKERTLAYHQSVEPALSYLEDRGITRATADTFLLGYVAEPMHGDERFLGTVSIPWLTQTGVVGFKFRRLETEGGRDKYDSPSGQTARLFNARSLADGGSVALVCEGEFDTILAASALSVPAVGTPGSNWMGHWSRCFGDFDRVVVVGDNDLKEDGSNPGKKHAEKVRKAIPGAELVLPPLGFDLTDWVLAEGVDVVREGLGI